MKKLTVTAIILTILFVLLAIANRPMAVEAQTPEKISPDVQHALQWLNPSEMVSVIVRLREQTDLSRISGENRASRQKNSITALKATADTSQKRLIALLTNRQLQGTVSGFQAFWIFNGLEVTATPDVINEIAAQFEVKNITLNEPIPEPATIRTTGAPEPNLTAINAPSLWNLGWRGQGVVVAIMDSGVDSNHPDLSAQWRGGTNSWFDPYHQHSTPADLSGHGTQVLGVMVGRDAGGTSIGVAPDAQWIAVKIFNDSGIATDAGIIAGFQWVLDPDGNPDTDDAPDVVNGSWGSPGCHLKFQPEVQALRAAGILPIFAAGNYGPNSETSVSPANYPESLAVGAIDNSNVIYDSGSRGPSNCGEPSTTYPEVVAPGVNINSSDRFNSYATSTGTSIAAPHVAGGLALLLSSFPQMDVDTQRKVLIKSAAPLTGNGQPDNNTGYGRIDLIQAYQMLADTRVAVSTNKTSIRKMDILTYTLTITHQGPATAAITVTGTFSGTPFDMLQVQAGQGGCTIETNSYVCALGIMPLGITSDTFTSTATTAITVATRPLSDGTLTQTIVATNSAIEASQVDNQISITTTIKPFTIFLPIVMKG